jgi:hypothetical protein
MIVLKASAKCKKTVTNFWKDAKGLPSQHQLISQISASCSQSPDGGVRGPSNVDIHRLTCRDWSRHHYFMHHKKMHDLNREISTPKNLLSSFSPKIRPQPRKTSCASRAFCKSTLFRRGIGEGSILNPLTIDTNNQQPTSTNQHTTRIKTSTIIDILYPIQIIIRQSSKLDTTTTTVHHHHFLLVSHLS